MPDSFNPGHDIDLTEEGATLSDDVFLLGFPLGFDQRMPSNINAGFPIPLVAKGCLAALPGISSPLPGGFLVAGQIDEGFSGGPVVISKNLKRPVVIGVISHNLRRMAEETLQGGIRMLVAHPANLVAGYSISEVTALIDKYLGGH